MRYKKSRKKSFLKSFFNIFLKTILVLIIIAIVGAFSYVGFLAASTESVSEEGIYNHLQRNSYIYDSSDKLIDTLYYSENREITKAEKITDETKNAFVAIEDKTFYKHHGFNFRRMIGAIIEKLSGKSSEISGTSSITQQLARNIYLSDTKSDRTLKRKITEMIYAYKIEKALTKDEILEAYLNTIYLGFGCYGVESAAQTYFSKPSDKLTIDEIAILAALPQAPDTYAPLKTEEDEYTTKISDGLYANSACEERRDIILDLMYEQGYISEKERDHALRPVSEILNPTIKEKDYTYTYFKDYLVQQVINDLVDKYSYDNAKAEKMVYAGGLNIYSTINSEAQKIVTKEFNNDYNFPGNYGEKPTQAAMVITEVGTGKIIAMAGGRHTSGEKLFNRATSPRQPGSSIKPLSIYSAALQKSFEYANAGKKFEFYDYDIDRQGTSGWGDYITASSTVVDEPTYINGDKWPLNATRTYSGRRTFRTALQQSINTCSVKILYQIGPEYSMQTLENYGISSLVLSGSTNDANAAALSLGAMTYGISPLEMSLAYGTFPNGGYRNEPVSYTKVTDSEGNVILSSSSKETQVLDPGVAWIMTDVLKSVVSSGLGRPASLYGVQVGGKTGTSDQHGDLWFVGFTPKYSAALWLGADDNANLNNNSSSVAAGLWGDIMSQVPDVRKGEYKAQPGNVIKYGGEYYTKGTETGAPRVYTYSSKKSSSKQSGSKKQNNTNSESNSSSESHENKSTTVPSEADDWVDDWLENN